MFWLIFAVALSLAIIWIYSSISKSTNYWEKKGIPHEKSWPIFGNMAPIALRQKPFAYLLQDYYNKFSDKRYFGFYQFLMPTLMIRDPDLIKQICIRDFDNFTDHQKFLPDSSDPFWNRNLFSMTGKNWHSMRCILSPAFTSSKMKGMFGFMVECTQIYVNHFKEQHGTITLEMKDIFTRFTNDVIASTAFGYKTNSVKDENNEFLMVGKNAFNFKGLRGLKFFGYALSPTLMKMLNVKFFDDYSKTFLQSRVQESISLREKENIIRPDMIHLLKEAQKGRLKYETEQNVVDSGFAVVQEAEHDDSEKTQGISDEDIVAQAMIFFLGGFDTVSTVLSHMAHELAVNPDCQKKLVDEIDRTLEECNGEITYDALLRMKYLDMITSETLRMWSPGIVTNRIAHRPFTIKATQPDEETVEIEAGTVIWIPVYAIHRDPKYHPNPDQFDPERFSDENKHKIASSTYMPFGSGPRSCIASRFALLEAKILIFFLLTEFEIVPVEKTQVPFVLSKGSVTVTNDCGYWLGLKPRKKVI